MAPTILMYCTDGILSQLKKAQDIKSPDREPLFIPVYMLEQWEPPTNSFLFSTIFNFYIFILVHLLKKGLFYLVHKFLSTHLLSK